MIKAEETGAGLVVHVATVDDDGRTVVWAGRDRGISWPTGQAAFEEPAGRVLPDQLPAIEAVGIGETLDPWWDGGENHMKTGIAHAAFDGNDRVITLEAREAYGFRDRKSQRLRSHCATTRRACGKLTPYQVRCPEIT